MGMVVVVMLYLSEMFALTKRMLVMMRSWLGGLLEVESNCLIWCFIDVGIVTCLFGGVKTIF